MRNIPILLAGLFLAASLLAGCGKKGSLYLPDATDKNVSQQTQSSPSSQP